MFELFYWFLQWLNLTEKYFEQYRYKYTGSFFSRHKILRVIRHNRNFALGNGSSKFGNHCISTLFAGVSGRKPRNNLSTVGISSVTCGITVNWLISRGRATLSQIPLRFNVSYLVAGFHTCNKLLGFDGTTCAWIKYICWVYAFTPTYRMVAWFSLCGLICISAYFPFRPAIHFSTKRTAVFCISTILHFQLFKPSTDAEGHLFWIKNKFLIWVRDSLVGSSQIGVFSNFWPNLSGSERQSNEPKFWLKILLEARWSPASIELLIDLLACLQPKLWPKHPMLPPNQKLAENALSLPLAALRLAITCR